MINKELRSLYRRHWDSFSKSLNEIVNDDTKIIKPSNPLLISLTQPEIYSEADIKVLIVGQENNDWGGIFCNEFEKILSIYEYFLPTQRSEFPHRGHFRNHINFFLRKLRYLNPNKTVTFLWTNIIKVGKAYDKNRPPQYILNMEREYFRVFSEELRILKPDIVLFMTGKYDSDIDFQLTDIVRSSMGEVPENLLQKLAIEDVKKAYRISHPNYLNFKGKEFYSEIYDLIIADFKS
ncbi:MAG: hypothetical protein PHP48_08580 [Bacteroidales bacterium]|jgi:hypothetical protein|nr:hypothetical protein [Bacteroidales bacterium]